MAALRKEEVWAVGRREHADNDAGWSLERHDSGQG